MFKPGPNRSSPRAGARHESPRESPRAGARQDNDGSGFGLQAALGWTALVAVLATALRNGGTPPGAWTLLGLLTLLLFAVQVALDLRRGISDPARRALPVALPYGAVLVWLQLQATPGLPEALAHPVWAFAPDGAAPTISADPDSGRQVALRLGGYAMLFWIMLRSAASGTRAAQYIQAFALFATALALYGIVAKFTGRNILLDLDDTGAAVRASFVNRNSYATFAVFGALANVTAYVRMTAANTGSDGRSVLRDFIESFFAGGWLYAFGAFLGLSAVAMTESRAGGMAGVVGLVVLIWALRLRRGSGNRLLWIIPAAVVGFVALVMSSGVVDRLESTGDDLRFVIYPHVIQGISDRPLLGHGAGAFADVFRAYVPQEAAAADWQHAHSTYLENAFEFGLPAAALFFLALALIGRRLLVAVFTRHRHRSAPALALACFSAAAVHSLVDFSLQIPAVAATFAVLLGIGWAQGFSSRGNGRSD